MKEQCRDMGIKMDDETLNSLLFVDDQVIVAEEKDNKNYMFRKRVEGCEKWGIEINMKKILYGYQRGRT